MLNKVMIIGRLGRDPELRYSQSGSPVCTLNIATDESYKPFPVYRIAVHFPPLKPLFWLLRHLFPYR